MKLTGERPMQVTERAAFSYKLLLSLGSISTVLVMRVSTFTFVYVGFGVCLPESPL